MNELSWLNHLLSMHRKLQIIKLNIQPNAKELHTTQAESQEWIILKNTTIYLTGFSFVKICPIN